MQKDIIVSLAVDGREKYSDIVKGLEKSIIDANWDGDVDIYKSFPRWIIPHSAIPYAFKYQFIKKKLVDGYRRIYWLDSTMRLVKGKNVADLLSQSEHGVVAFDNEGHPLINYINDTAMKHSAIQNFDGIKQTWGGALFFDFSKWPARSIISGMMHHIAIGTLCDDGTTRDGFKGHRHDQAIMSMLLYDRKIPLLPYGVIAAPKDVTDKTYIQYGD